MKSIVELEVIEKKIYLIKGRKVMLDSDLAVLYGVRTFNLNKAVKRNISRFPEDFMFQLTKAEFNNLIFQFGISSLKMQTATSHYGGRRHLPYVFTEQGVAMLSSVLNSDRAAQVNIAVMRTFVKLREFLSAHKELAYKLAELERKIEKHDEEIHAIFEAIRQLMAPPELPRKKIGFNV